MKKLASKDRRHNARKRIAMKKGQFAAIVPGKGMNPMMFIDMDAGLIRVTKEGIFLYRS